MTSKNLDYLSNYPILSAAKLEELELEQAGEDCDYYREQGFNRGYSIGDNIDFVAVDSAESWLETQIGVAHDAEDNDRSFSPFELTANELNKHQFSEDVWEAFNKGISEGIVAAINERFLELVGKDND